MAKKARLNKILQDLLTLRQISSTDLARFTGIPKSTISTYLASAKSSYNPNHLSELSEYFNVSVDYLLFGSPARALTEGEKSLGTHGSIEIIIRRVCK